jgi:hypothetical protein
MKKKLVFRSETLRALTKDQLVRAMGGATTSGRPCTAGNSGCSTADDGMCDTRLNECGPQVTQGMSCVWC